MIEYRTVCLPIQGAIWTRIIEFAQITYMDALAENTPHIDYDLVNSPKSFTSLKDLGAKQGYVTYNDIRLLFPEGEQDDNYLDHVLWSAASI